MDFVKNFVLTSFKLNEDKWKKCLSAEDKKKVLEEFLDSEENLMLCVSVNAAGDLAPSPEYSCGSDRKVLFKKKKKIKLTGENIRRSVLVGNLSPALQDQVSNLHQNMCGLGVHTFKKNDHPTALSEDFKESVVKFQNNLHQLSGRINGRTILVYPVNFEKVEQAALEMDKQKPLKDKSLTVILETTVVNWSHQLDPILQINSPTLQEGSPALYSELHFWEHRHANLENISSQLASSKAQIVVELLEAANSAYFQPWVKICKSISEALEDADNICIYMKPLQKQFERTENLELPGMKNHIDPLMVTVCLVWANSRYPRYKSHFIFLLREIGGLLIKQAQVYLDPDKLLSEDASDSLRRLQKSLDILQLYRNSYENHGANLTKYKKAGIPLEPWSFDPTQVFLELDRFTVRLKTIKDILLMTLDLAKLETLVVGDFNYQEFDMKIKKLHLQFLDAYKVFTEKAADKCVDMIHKEFEVAAKELTEKTDDIYQQIGTIFCCVFDNASVPCNAFKTVKMFGSLLEHPLIAADAKGKFSSLLNMFDTELNRHKLLFNQHMERLHCPDFVPIHRSFPPVAGELQWAKNLKEQIQVFFSNLKSVPHMDLEAPEAVQVLQKSERLIQNLDRYSSRVYKAWARDVGQLSQQSLSLPLIKRNPTTRLISVNYSPQLKTMLREVRYLQSHPVHIPEDAMQIYKTSEQLRDYVNNLEHIALQYNKMIQKELIVEAPLVQDQLLEIESELRKAEESLSWNSQGVWQNIQHVRHLVCELVSHLQKTKDNMEEIQSCISSWAKPMFDRKEGSKDFLFALEDSSVMVNKFYSLIRSSGEKIHSLLKTNQELFRAESSTEGWKAYVNLIDDLVAKGFADSIMCSLQFFLNIIEGNVVAPLFEVHLELKALDMVFTPSMESGVGCSFPDMMERVINDVFSMSSLVPRLAEDSPFPHYQEQMETSDCLVQHRQLLMKFVERTVAACIDFCNFLKRYSYLYKKDRKTYFCQFLLFGDDLNKGDIEVDLEDNAPQSPPTLENFREQLDSYERLYKEVESLDPVRVIHGWVKLDCLGLKVILLNSIKKWSLMFKQHLVDVVIKSLSDLERFITRTKEDLSQELDEKDDSSLVNVMGHLLAVREKQQLTDGMFEPIQQTVSLLNEYEQELPEAVCTQFEGLPNKWKSLEQLAISVKEKVASWQSDQAAHLRETFALFETELLQLRESFNKNMPISKETYQFLDDFQQQIQEKEEKMASLLESANLFEVPAPKNIHLQLCRHKLSLLKELWDMITVVNTSIDSWKMAPWMEIQVEEMELELKSFYKEIGGLDSKMKEWDAFKGLDSGLRNILISFRSVGELRSPAMRGRHWHQLMAATGVRFTMNQDTTLGDILQLNLHHYEDEVREIVDRAVQEMSVEKTLLGLKSTWEGMQFQFESHPRTQLPLLCTDEELIETLEDNQVQLQSLMSNKYITHFLEEVSSWQNKVWVIDSVISVWFEVQRGWSHLESIFICSEDIRTQLPEDTERFIKIDVDFRKLANSMHETPNVVEGTNKPGLLNELEDIQKRLLLCEKALAEYLDTKRLTFPRFCFVSSADLLDILSNGTNPQQVQKHLSKLFDSLSRVKFEADGEGNPTKTAVGMYSKEEEYVPFDHPCDCSGQVEVWLNRVLDSMRSTVRHEMSKAVKNCQEKPREQWLFEYPAQVALTCSQIWWTADVTYALSSIEKGYGNSLKKFYKTQVTQLETLISMLIGQLTPGDRQKIMTICTIDVHARDVVDKMISQKIENSQAFSWVSQLRHRWSSNESHCFANICDAQFIYSYEYLGNTPRLVITPLTDRCYITLTQSLHLSMGGAPAGPAGTGKTETTKDLGRALGIMVYVFNCSEQMDYKSCANIYKGLAQTGAWGCFDEFNRISVEVLSVVALQVKSIQEAVREKKKRFFFMGEEISISRSVGIFITMNPGYAGRTELPENLKALFRPCAMVVPDFEMICEIMLVAEGFLDARVLARKFITLYTLCKELLSKQDHYDWGLRAIKSVLVVAGSLKREDPERAEDQVLMRALRDFNVPKIVTDDMPVFMGLIGDLFPALDVPRKVNPDFEKQVRSTVLDLKLQAEDNFVLKVVQLQELLAVRHSVFVIGNAGTGKSQVLKSLYTTYKNIKLRPVWTDLNPKAVTNDELFGIVHPATREWKDGLFSSIMRDLANITHDGPKWIVLDGDIDPMWIESLNTVMDDNKVLTLASNERIPLKPSMRLIFEISHLRTATPATVSRAGILYINPGDLGWNPQVFSWIKKREHQSERTNLFFLFEKYVPSCLEALRTRFKTIIPITEQSLIQMLCHLLECLLSPENTPTNCSQELHELYFVFAAIWAFGGALSREQLVDYRVEFSKWWVAEFKTIKFPSSGTVFDYYVNPETKMFEPWSNIVPQFEMDPEAPLQGCLVHTTETIQVQYFMDRLLEHCRPVMLVGSAGTGKSVLVGNKLEALDPEKYLINNVPFNYYTTSAILQAVLEKPLEKKGGRIYGPPGRRKMVCFIDDLNIPEVDTYGTVQPHTLIRQHMDYNHWYDRSKLLLKDIHNVQYITCMNPTAGSFTIDPRLQRHFSVFALPFPGNDALTTIYSSILSQHLQAGEFSAAVQKSCSTLVSLALAMHQGIFITFLLSAVKFHYIFNLRDISNIFQGILFCTSECLKTPEDLLKVYLHETCRVYRDKLLDEPDIQTFDKLQAEIVKKFYKDSDEVLEQTQKLNLYCHFAGGLEESRYSAVQSLIGLNKTLLEAMDRHNQVNATMNLVLFEDAMAHVCAINRILEAPRGNALLVGVGGSGKQSLTRLAAFIANLDVFQITLRKGYGVSDLKSDLASLCIKAGVKDVGTVFLMTDAQMIDEKFLVPVNDFLASGEIPDLFQDDEVDQIIESMKPAVHSAGMIVTRETCWKFFISRVRRRLKVVLCFSPVGSKLRLCSRKFPAVINCTTIIWFHEWPQEALESVSLQFLEGVEVNEPEVKESVSKFMAYVHTSVNQASKEYLTKERRFNYATPKSFLEQITLFRSLLGHRSKELTGKINRLENGLQKFESAASQVDNLKVKLADQQLVLQQKNDDADKLIKVLGVEKEKVSKERALADEEEKKVAAITVTVSAKQKDCQKDLDNAQPLLEAALKALDTLNKKNLTELKSFKAPVEAVTRVLEAVMILKAPSGKVPKDLSWKEAKVMMANVDKFLSSLKTFDGRNIPETSLKALEPYLQDPSFCPAEVATKSSAAEGMCLWVLNTVDFYKIYCEVEPKKQALKKANDELQAAEKNLKRIQGKVKTLDENYAKLQSNFEKATEEKLQCQREAEETEQTISQANRLMNALASEKVRWTKDVENLKNQESTMCGDVLLITAFVSYAGYFTKHFRFHLMESCWRPYLSQLKVPIPVSPDLDPLTMLIDDADIATWQNEGLPADRMSTENATILTSCQRWPLMVDPQLQGINWVKNKYGEHLRVIRTEQRGYLDVIERALAVGDIVLIENLGETLDPVLGPLLGRETIKKGRYIKIGDKECEYNHSFRLILHTKLANPHYQPELQAQCTLINFTVTRDGLEDQLLAAVVSMERPDLEKQKSDLTKQQNQFRITLKTLEDDLLSRLSSASGNFLGDTELVESLERNKSMAEDIEKQVKEAKVTEAKINEIREYYRPAAARASLLYFIMNDLNKINPMYQFSLKAFSVVFQRAVKKAEPEEEVQQRVSNLTDSITFSVFQYTTRGLFECDKLMFVTQLVFQVLRMNNEINPVELDFLLRCPIQPGGTSPVDYLSNQAWGGIKSLSSMEEFRNLDQDIESTPNRWKRMVESECPEREQLPGEWKKKTSLQRLCIMRVLRPDRMTNAIRNFVEEKLGSKYTMGRSVDFASSFEESDSATPMFFILSPGVDPLKAVEEHGKKLGYTLDNRNLHNVSLGQGQELVAEQALDVAAKNGHWVILQNIHLVARWLKTLEKLVEQHAEQSHENFRVFFSAEPSATPETHIIPHGILENSIKVTNEPPTGMNANLHKALDNFNQVSLAACTQENEFKSIWFALCYFHAVVAGRTKFGPQGWNRPYPFNIGDLTISVNVLQNYLEANPKVPYEDLRYLFGEIMYGGHITDDWDRRLCCSYLEEFIKPEMMEGKVFLAPKFPLPGNMHYESYHKYIDDNLPEESPYLYGLHPNAEIGFLTQTSEKLFCTVLEMQPRDEAVGEEGGMTREEKVCATMEEITGRLPDQFNMPELFARAQERTPYEVVALQECERMNFLIREIRSSLRELSLGLKGELSMTSDMESLQNAIFLDMVPDSWTKLAFPSTLSLALWFNDLLARISQLEAWSVSFSLPPVVWLSGFFNPQSFLTAIMQDIARRNKLPLDSMTLQCEVTKRNPEDYSSPPREGAYIHGLFMEGAQWETQKGLIVPARMKELTSPMPVIYIKAVPANKQENKDVYRCPVYRTRQRGPTYVWTFNLKTKEKPSTWTIAGVALLLQV
ncbi:dynein heavy chain 9, axonemal [Oryzias melastigma]|nr:dynein heavy chain 9, axonemal [Oryzias melastigma]